MRPSQDRDPHITFQADECLAQILPGTDSSLEQVQKMAAIGHLAGGVAHDFNNLLGVIIGNLEVIADCVGEHEKVATMVQDALDAALRAASLTQYLLAYARSRPRAREVLDLTRRLGELTRLLQRTLGENIRIETRLATGLWKIRVEPDQFDTALLNLAVNARDAMSGNGLLTITAENVEHPQTLPPLTLGASTIGHVCLTVTDTGTGMDKEVVAQALKPFFTTKPVGKGTGLGLSMVHGFVEQSSGHIEIDSTPGQGTTIRMYFPAVPDQDVVVPPAQDRTRMPQPG